MFTFIYPKVGNTENLADYEHCQVFFFVQREMEILLFVVVNGYKQKKNSALLYTSLNSDGRALGSSTFNYYHMGCTYKNR